MKTLNPPDKVIMQLLGRQVIKEDIPCRPLIWTLKLPIEGDILLHNFLTGESLVFEDEEDIKNARGHLTESFFYVPKEHNDLKLVEELRSAVRLINRRNTITSFKILTTTACNARCAYCYEQGIKWQPMDIKTADKVIEYILKKSGDKKVTLSWFGGEPLLNTEVIDYICTKLRTSEKEFSSVMTSNGYLFSNVLCRRAADEWKLKNIQITLDGTHDEYNRIKNYISVSDDPYFRVLDNISTLASLGVRVNVRLNMGLDNYSDISALADELAKRFGGLENISVYVSGLFQETVVSGDKSELYRRLEEITDKLYKYGLAKRSFKALRLRPSGCMADGDSHRGISPTGELMKCEHHIYTNVTGSVFDDTEDEGVLEFWKERLEYEEICADCFALPTCYRLKNCPVSHICSPEEKRQYIAGIINALKEKYRAQKNI